MSQETESKFIKGLDGVVAAQTDLSEVDGANGRLSYRGVPIGEMVEHSHFEEVTYWLWFGKWPNAAEFKAFQERLTAQRTLSPEVLHILEELPKTTQPMSVLRTMTSILGVFDGRSHIINPEESLRKAFKLTAVFPTVITAYYHLREGRRPIEPDLKLSHAANFYYMIHGKRPEKEMERALDAYMILLADHGLNASTFAARVTAGTLSNLYSAITSAVGTLMGDLHGSANQRAMEMILEIGDPSKAEAYVSRLLDEKKKVMGFGHRIYKTCDPRAEAFREIAHNLCVRAGEMKWMEIASKVEKVMLERKSIPCNVDFFSAPVLYILGFPVDFFTTVFAASRVVGWSAHVLEQHRDNRLIRPQSEYIGPRDQHYIPLNERV